MSTYFSYTRARGIEHSSSSEALEFAQIIRLKIVDIYIYIYRSLAVRVTKAYKYTETSSRHRYNIIEISTSPLHFACQDIWKQLHVVAFILHYFFGLRGTKWTAWMRRPQAYRDNNITPYIIVHQPAVSGFATSYWIIWAINVSHNEYYESLETVCRSSRNR